MQSIAKGGKSKVAGRLLPSRRVGRNKIKVRYAATSLVLRYDRDGNEEVMRSFELASALLRGLLLTSALFESCRSNAHGGGIWRRPPRSRRVLELSDTSCAASSYALGDMGKTVERLK